jgi:hypothetical protein
MSDELKSIIHGDHEVHGKREAPPMLLRYAIRWLASLLLIDIAAVMDD